jgi:phospholipid/cholesterol/gamma-HCH transport system substrate-binding protein
MSRTLAWRDLKTGVIAFAAIVGIAVSTLLFAKVGALHGDTTDIYVVTDDAPGVLNGTEVWLSGQKVGLVKDIHFRPPSTDTLERLAIHLQILSKHLNYIRRDAYADIRPGGNLIGSPVVWISSGTSRVPAVKAGDTLVEVSTGKMKPVGERIEALGARMTMLADSGGKVLRLLQTQAGTAGRLIGSGWPRVTEQTDRISRLARKATAGEGTLGALRRGELGAHLAGIRASKDSISRLISSGDGNVGRFRRDSTLINDVAHLQDQLDSLRAIYGAGSGIGKMRSDSSLTKEMARIRVELAALMADLKKHPLRYINF